jgi:hypothetical protein
MQALLNRMRSNPKRPVAASESLPALTLPKSPGSPGSPLPRPLRRCLDRVLAGAGQSAWIEGDAGAGKTELLNLTLAEAAAGGCRLIDCTARGSAPRFGLDVILQRFDLNPSSDELQRILHSRSGLRATLRRLSAASPLVIAVDDLDRTNLGSVEFWGRLAVEIRSVPVLLLATARAEVSRAEVARVRDDVRSRPLRVMTCHCGSARPDSNEVVRIAFPARRPVTGP